jgi:diaminopimelate epimerase
MKIKFYKYQGTGNDFVMIDNRHLFFPKNNTQLIAHICNRRFGIGGDGLIHLSDFKMIYYNADGNESSMCGNGGRCIVAFAKQIGLIQKETTFNAVDGLHFATINASNEVALQMISVNSIKIDEDYTFLNTGSPHHVQMVDELETFNVYEEGNKIRYSALYANGGSNVNFVNQVNQNTFRLRTYERGVEDETLSCGTGATAVAIAMFATGKTIENHIKLMVEGGELNVTFEKKGDNEYENVFLIGPATFVFEGEVIV